MRRNSDIAARADPGWPHALATLPLPAGEPADRSRMLDRSNSADEIDADWLPEFFDPEIEYHDAPSLRVPLCTSSGPPGQRARVSSPHGPPRPLCVAAAAIAVATCSVDEQVSQPRPTRRPLRTRSGSDLAGDPRCRFWRKQQCGAGKRAARLCMSSSRLTWSASERAWMSFAGASSARGREVTGVLDWRAAHHARWLWRRLAPGADERCQIRR
jgi:hypothetical protein